MNKVNKESTNVLEENISKLKKLFPEIFSEGKIDFEKLKETLGEFVDSNDEKYTFSWAGRSESIQNLQTPSRGTLIPEKDESVNFDETENIFIEGENLEVLKLLQKSYNEKIKMIYIDPPYNTGKDFVYKDDFKNSIVDYLEKTTNLN
jgi:adenine-specific DNA-methyltransferase